MMLKNEWFRKYGIGYWLLGLLLLGGGPLQLAARQPYTPQVADPLTEPWRWKQFPELEGKGIRHIVQSKDQRVWVSCNEGVLEYNGYVWKEHNADNGLTAAPVEQLLVTTGQTIYASSSSGIFRYNGTTWSHFFRVPADRSFTFHHIEQLRDGSIVAGTNWGLIHFQQDGRLRFFTSPAKRELIEDDYPDASWVLLPAAARSPDGGFEYVSDLLERPEGEVWLALSTQSETGKILRFNWFAVHNGRIAEYAVVSSEPGRELGEDQKLLAAKDGRIWVVNSTSDKGILIFDAEQWSSLRISEVLGGDEFVSDILQTADGTIWLASIAKIIAYREGEWQLYRAPQYPVPANRIILQNNQSDQLWVTGYKSKMLLLDYSMRQWLTYQNLSFQCEVAEEEQWYLERSGRIVQQRGEDWISMGTEDGLMDAPVRLVATSRGQVWAAGSHRGVAATARWTGDRWERHLHPKLSWGIDYRAVFEARDGTLWFGAAVDADKRYGFDSGVLQLPDPTAAELEWIHHRSGENGLNQSNVYGIGQSADGRIWIGGSQLHYYDGQRWETQTDERLQQYVNCIYSTERLLIVGSRYYGVFVYDGESWTNYSTEQGLSGNTIISIDALSDSTFIVATENDITKFDGRSWTPDVFPDQLDIDFEGGSIRHAGGYIWVNHVPRSWKRRAFQNALPADTRNFFTTRYRPSQTPPETSIDFNPVEISAAGNTLITWKGKDYFAKTAVGQLMYSYRLDSEEWSSFSTARQHTFISLPSGAHTLEVRARDLDFNVDPTPDIIEFKVLFPIWQQLWFIGLILAFLTIFGIYEYRVITKKRKLEVANVSLEEAYENLQSKNKQIAQQNQEILSQQEQILAQSRILESNNQDLEERNEEIRQQRDQLEEMVEQVEELSRTKLNFFTNISHELRTPLTLILGPITQLKEEGHTLGTEQRNHFHNIIYRNAARLLKLINQLLEMRRIEESALEMDTVNIHLGEFLLEIRKLFDELARRRRIQFDVVCEGEVENVTIDVDKVEKILVNLLSNAFKHTPEGGRIRVVLTAEEPAGNTPARYFTIRVEDTGSGISEEAIDSIFNKYFTLNSDQPGLSGAGIGLSYIKDLIHLLQGEIYVQSRLGEGTKFSIRLPYVPARGKRSGTAIEPPPLGLARQEAALLLNTYLEETAEAADLDVPAEDQRPLLLVVEDNPDMAHFLVSILKAEYRVITAADGRIGLQMANDHSLDLIISDVMMPEMDGFTFCEQIKTTMATSHIPVILLTAKTREESKLSGYRKGADDYLTKPFSPELLRVRVNNLLRQREQLREVFNREFMLTPKTETVTSPDEEFLQKLVELMNDNLAEAEFNVEAMCQSMHLSHMHLIRKVKQLTGKKPVELLRSFRMKKAKDLLAQQKLSISEVAYMVGFDLPNSFSRSFKKEFDQTPTQFVSDLPEPAPGFGMSDN